MRSGVKRELVSLPTPAQRKGRSTCKLREHAAAPAAAAASRQQRQQQPEQKQEPASSQQAATSNQSQQQWQGPRRFKLAD